MFKLLDLKKSVKRYQHSGNNPVTLFLTNTYVVYCYGKNIYSLLFIILAVGLSPVAYGQLSFGVRVGPNLSSVKFQESGGSDQRVGLYSGVLGEIKLNEAIFLRSEILYSLKGWRFEGGSIALHYLNLPLLVGYRPAAKLSFVLGPEFGYLLKAARRPKLAGVSPSFEEIDYGILLGASYFIVNNLALEIRYTHGFDTLIKVEGRDFNNAPTNDVQRDGANRAFQFGVAYQFRQER